MVQTRRSAGHGSWPVAGCPPAWSVVAEHPDLRGANVPAVLVQNDGAARPPIIDGHEAGQHGADGVGEAVIATAGRKGVGAGRGSQHDRRADGHRHEKSCQLSASLSKMALQERDAPRETDPPTACCVWVPRQKSALGLVRSCRRWSAGSVAADPTPAMVIELIDVHAAAQVNEAGQHAADRMVEAVVSPADLKGLTGLDEPRQQGGDDDRAQQQFPHLLALPPVERRNLLSANPHEVKLHRYEPLLNTIRSKTAAKISPELRFFQFPGSGRRLENTFRR